MRMIRFALMALAFVSLQAHAKDDRNLAVNQANSGSEKRIALVIGNSKYKEKSLANPANDARDVAVALRELGFDVIAKIDVTQKEMNRAIVQFGEKLNANTIALFYYAGHGMQVKGKNYLIPIDAEIATENAARGETVDVDTVLDQLNRSPLSIVILDACRNNPFERRFRSTGGGLAAIDAPKGTLIAYATAPGSVASDGKGRNGLYTQELLQAMRTPGLPVERMFKEVRKNVTSASGDTQTPWEMSSLTGEFYFKLDTQVASLVPAPARPSPVGADPAALELDAWNTSKEMDTVDAYQAYLADHANGRHAKFAQAAINKLKSVQQPNQIAMHTPSAIQSGSGSHNSNKNSEVTQQIELAKQSVIVGAFVQDYAKKHPVSEGSQEQKQRLQQQSIKKAIDELRVKARIEIIASDETSAMVNDISIPQARVDMRVKVAVAQGQADSPELRKAIRDDMINLEVMVQEATKLGLNKNDEVVQQTELAKQSVLVGAFVQDYAKNHPISEGQLKQEYDKLKAKLGDKEYNVRHILVDTEDEAKAIIVQLNSGGFFGSTFSGLARKSKDTGSAAQGGSLGWAVPSNFVPPFANAVLNLKKGERTKYPVQTTFGWHVIMVDDIRDLKVPPFDELKPNLQQRLQQQAIKKAIDELRVKARIEIIASDETSAMVNNISIPQARVDMRVKVAVAQGQADSPELRKAIRDDMINLEVMVQEATKLGLSQ